MKKIKYVIIGGGIAGTTTAEFIRMSDPSGSIVIISEEPELLYSRVLLPHYLRGQVSLGRLYIRKEAQYKEKNIKIIDGIKSNKINTQNKIVYLDNNEKISYENLLIASGGAVNRLEIPGNNLPGVTYLRTIKEAQEIKEIMSKAKNGLVIGGGFIGIEYAETFVRAGITTTVVIREPYFWQSVVGENMGKAISRILEESGVKIINQTEPTEFIGENKLNGVKLKNGESVRAEIAGVGIGIHMNLDYLENSGVKTGRGVVTNEFLETSVKNVWAAGDVAEFKDIVFGKHHRLGNWSNAAAQGKVVGSNMVVGWGQDLPTGGGKREKFETISAYTIGIFDNSFVFMGDPVTGKETQIVERGSIQDGKLGRIYLRNSVMTGAALINLPADRRPIENMIKNRVKISVSKDKLSDLSFDLNILSRD